MSPFGMKNSLPLGPRDMFVEGWTEGRDVKSGKQQIPTSSSTGTGTGTSSSSAPKASSTGTSSSVTEPSVPWCPPLQEKQVSAPKLRDFQLFYGDINIYVFIRHYQVCLSFLYFPLCVGG